MKRLVTILFLLIFSLNYCGHYIIFYIERWEVRNLAKEEIIAGVPDRFLDVFTDNGHIRWEEEGKEFSVNGAFYDVVSIKKISGTTFYYCLNDSSEALLLKKFAGTVRTGNTDNEKGKSAKHAFKLQLTDLNVLHDVGTTSFVYKTNSSFVNYKTDLVSNCTEIIIPPPRS